MRQQFFFLLALIVAALGSNAVQAQCGANLATETARGSVFLDLSGNGRRDTIEPGIGDVAVSNGCDVVLTDSSGFYEIDLAPYQLLFISKPADYQVAVDESNVPQFFYRHYPEGTPEIVAGTAVEWVFPVIEATGPLPEAIDFPLTDMPDASEQFTAHGFADTQARFDLSEDMLREDLINPLIDNPYGVDFGLTVGDVVYDNLALYPRHKAMMGLMGIPQWYVPGNHDINFQSPNAGFANETYKLHFGPTYYSFNHGNVHFVVLNNVEYAGAEREFDEGRYRGYLTANQLQWLEQDLSHVSTDKLIVIATHIPLVAIANDGRSLAATGPNTKNFAELLRILEPFQHIYGLAGHDTSNSWKVEVNHRHGWAGAPWIAHTLAEVRGNGWTSGPADLRGVKDAMMQDGNPNGFYVLRFDDVKLVPEFIPFPFGPDAGRRLRITFDPPMLAPADGGIHRGSLWPETKVVVNLFDGGERDRVWMSLDDGPDQPMTYSVRTDPYVERVHARYAETSDSYGRATRSSHIWELPVSNSLEPGLHHIKVTSEDEFGQRQRGDFTFEILAD
ncbi:MAG: calcineurin-like phosphoesterase C-terminal domain-containing protein [Gammaproteobacteria bacterium]|nr:calcineurin-like phosphoesterase C-terminal domain-containing protein [Gammaproteobacteria bacterium]